MAIKYQEAVRSASPCTTAFDQLLAPSIHARAHDKAESCQFGPGLLRVHCAWEYSLRPDAGPAGFTRSGAPAVPATGPKLLIALPLDYREQVPITFELSTRPQGRIRAACVGATVMASFSSRGQNLSLPDIIAPSVTAPGVAIVLVILAINFVGDGVTEALDPALRRRR